MPEHTFNQPVPVVVRVEWADDGEEHIDTVTLGWTGQTRGTNSRRAGWTPATSDAASGL
jgi:hypothetical protein